MSNRRASAAVSFQLPAQGSSLSVGRERSSSGVDEAIVAPKSAQGEMHPFFLTFMDAEKEARYVRFAYIHSGFYGGKLWHAVAFAIVLISFFYYHTIRNGFSGAMFYGNYWVGMTITAVITVAMGICCFVERLYEYREIFFLLSLMSHWPAYTIAFFFGLGDPFVYSIAILSGCFFFCAFVVQARFSRVIWFLTLTPLLTLIISTSVDHEHYWEKHSVPEIAYWGIMFVPVIILYFYETTSRRSFEAMEHCEESIRSLEEKIENTRNLIAHLFPHTPSADLLTNGENFVRCKSYDHVGMVVTDLAGFTAWTSRTDADVVIETLSRMFEAFDANMAPHGVEKVSTVGDCLIAALFPRKGNSILSRARHTVEYSLAILPHGGELKLRIGAHIGDLTGGFVGSSPPKFDIFGPDVDKVKLLEQGGVPGKVHMSEDLLRLLKGAPVDDETTSMGGTAVSCWSWPKPGESMSMELVKNDSTAKYTFVSDKKKNAAGDGSLEGEAEDVELNGSTQSATKGRAEPFASMSLTTDALLQQSTDEHQATGFTPEEVFKISEALVSMGRGGGVPAISPQPPEEGMGGRVTSSGSMMVLPVSASGVMEPDLASTHLSVGLPEPTSLFSQPSFTGSSMGSASPPRSQSVSPRRESQGPTAADLPVLPDAQDSPMRHPRRASRRVSDTSGLLFLTSRIVPMSGTITQSVDIDVEDASGAQPLLNTAPDTFHPVLLEFKNRRTELRYIQFIMSGKLLDRTQFTMAMLMMGLLAAHLLLGCFDTIRNRLILGYNVLAMTIMFAVFKKSMRFQMFALYVSMNYGIIALVSVFQTADCERSHAKYNTGVIISMYVLQTILVTQFMLKKRLKIRLMMNFCCLLLGYLCNLLRTYVMDDDVLPFDLVWVVGFLGLAFVSYFADYTLRSAFVADRHLKALLRHSKGRYQQATRAALDVMLPSFVSARLLGDSKAESGDKDDKPGSPDGGQDPLSLSTLGDKSSGTYDSSAVFEDGAIDASKMTTKDKLWDFSGVCVMFVYFNWEVKGSAEHYIETMHQAFLQVEAVLASHGVHKIKTIGSCVLCVTGHDGERDCVPPMVAAAIETRRLLLAAHSDWELKIGIHYGAAIGAVLGSESLLFDIFGDTVNMASRMQSNAPPRGIQITSAVNERCFKRFETRERPVIQVKGKGHVQPFEVTGEPVDPSSPVVSSLVPSGRSHPLDPGDVSLMDT